MAATSAFRHPCGEPERPRWTVTRLKYLGEAIIGLTYDPSQVVDGDAGTLVFRSSNVQNGKIVLDDNVYVDATIPPDLITRIGDILICSRNGSRALIGKNATIDALSVGQTFGAFMTIFRSRHSRYVSWLLNSPLFEFQSGAFLTSTINQLTVGVLNNFEVPMPPELERDTIVAFLDCETGKIDALVAEQERLIALLKEKRQAVISHAVTKGLNPNAPMNESSVPWLGEVPAHWEVKRVKHCLRSLDQGWSPQCEGYPVDSPDEWGVLKVGCVNGGTFDKEQNKKLPHDLDGIDELSVKQGDILISRANTRDLVGSAALVSQNQPRLMMSDKLYRVRSYNTICLPEFLTLYLNCHAARGQIELRAGGASQSMLNISQDVITDMKVPLPPVSEQKSVTTRLSASLQTIDSLSTQATRAITLLRERRAALISAAVTGEIDVRATASAVLDAA